MNARVGANTDMPATAPTDHRGRQLRSWKAIAAYLGVSVRTAQRWEAREGMPIRRHGHTKLSTAYAFAGELDAWRERRPDLHRAARPKTPVAQAAEDHLSSIAVVPFSSPHADQEAAVVADGLTDDLNTALSQIDGLRVVARTSAAYVAGDRRDVRELGQRLDVETVLEGGVRRDGKRVRVTAQLISTADGSHLWAHRFDRELGNLFDLQDELARDIAGSLRVRLTHGDALASRRTVDAETYRLFLRGRFFWHERSREGLERALGCFQQAIERNGAFAAAHAGRADCHVFLWAHGGCPWVETIPEADAAIARALALDASLGEVQTSYGLICILHDDFEGARAAFRKALSLNPNDARARHWDAMATASLGFPEQAVAEITRALSIDPFGMTVNQDLGRILYQARRHEEAISQLLHTLEIAPRAPWARVYLAFALMEIDRVAEARDVSECDATLRAFVKARGGDPDEARALLARAEGDRLPLTWQTLLHLALGATQPSMQCLRRARDAHEIEYLELLPKVNPVFDSLRAAPDFDASL